MLMSTNRKPEIVIVYEIATPSAVQESAIFTKFLVLVLAGSKWSANLYDACTLLFPNAQ